MRLRVVVDEMVVLVQLPLRTWHLSCFFTVFCLFFACLQVSLSDCVIAFFVLYTGATTCSSCLAGFYYSFSGNSWVLLLCIAHFFACFKFLNSKPLIQSKNASDHMVGYQIRLAFERTDHWTWIRNPAPFTIAAQRIILVLLPDLLSTGLWATCVAFFRQVPLPVLHVLKDRTMAQQVLWRRQCWIWFNTEH